MWKSVYVGVYQLLHKLTLLDAAFFPQYTYTPHILICRISLLVDFDYFRIARLMPVLNIWSAIRFFIQ